MQNETKIKHLCCSVKFDFTFLSELFATNLKNILWIGTALADLCSELCIQQYRVLIVEGKNQTLQIIIYVAHRTLATSEFVLDYRSNGCCLLQ